MPPGDQRTTMPLFDVEGGAKPPADAVELYVGTPMTVGILYSWAMANDDAKIADGVFELCLHALDRVMPYLQREAGYVKVGPHFPGPRGRTIGKYLTGQLETTTVAEVYADQHTDVARIHQHLYLGATARCDEDRQFWPVHLAGVKLVAPAFHALYLIELKRLLTNALDVKWSAHEDERPMEIIDPPLHRHIKEYPRRVTCRGPFRGVAQRWNLDEISAPPAHRDAV